MATPSPFPKSASHLHSCEMAPKRIYFDRSHYTSLAQQIAALSTSKTIYAGNLSFGVTADQLTAFLPGACKVVMGVNRQTKSPCGFAFVEFESIQYARDAVLMHSGRVLDQLGVKVELDPGWKPGREFGRGEKGGQLRDEMKARNGGVVNIKRRETVNVNNRSSSSSSSPNSNNRGGNDNNRKREREDENENDKKEEGGNESKRFRGED